MPRQGKTNWSNKKKQSSTKKQVTKGTHQPDTLSDHLSSSTSTCPSSPNLTFSPPATLIRIFTPKDLQDFLLLEPTTTPVNICLEIRCDLIGANVIPSSSSASTTDQPQQQFWQDLMNNCDKCKAISSLKLIGLNKSDEIIAQLVESPNLTNLRELTMWRVNLTQQSIETIANCSKFLTLESLMIKDEPDFGLQGVSLLAQSPYLVNLKRLSLINTLIGNEGFKKLLQSKNLHLYQLEELNLMGNSLANESFEFLKEKETKNKLKKLKNLCICGNSLTKSFNLKMSIALKENLLASQKRKLED